MGPHPIARKKLTVRTFDRAPCALQGKDSSQGAAQAGAQVVI